MNETQLTPTLRDAFWQAVEECLVEFHQKTPRNALLEAAQLRREVETTPPGLNGDLIYHAEPFYVACDLAGLHDLSEQGRLLAANRQKYDSILSVHGW
jgi:hypothetical protein